MRKAATRQDWTIQPMPDSAKRIAFQRHFSADEYRLLRLGFIPLEPGDNWFAYFEDAEFSIYPRQAGGHCGFKIRLQESGNGCEIAEAWANRKALPSWIKTSEQMTTYLDSVFNELLEWIEHTESPAKRSDWQTLPMPDSKTELAVEIVIPAERYEKLRWGFIPRAMEDHWFYFMEDQRLHAHRSWTGHCIYEIEFARVADGYKPVSVWANRDPEQYRGDDAGDLEWIEHFLNG